MPRTSRVVVPNYPHHIMQRGHNRGVVFVEDEDYFYYLENLREWKQKVKSRVYGYCLMTNHVHLIVDPGENAESMALLMKHIAGRQTRYVNTLEGRRGTLWEGRYKSSPIHEENYLLACCRYVELNPVRAGIVEAPEKYKWSSYTRKVGLESIGWLDLDPCYLGLGATQAERQEQYAEWVKEFIPQGEWDLIRQAIQRGQLTGSERFVEEVSEKISRRIEFRGQGRPKNIKK